MIVGELLCPDYTMPALLSARVREGSETAWRTNRSPLAPAAEISCVLHRLGRKAHLNEVDLIE